jgi:hypothetical protein
MTQKKTTKILATIALLAIISGIIGTGVLVIFSTYQNQSSEELSPEKLQDILKNIDTNSGTNIQ